MTFRYISRDARFSAEQGIPLTGPDPAETVADLPLGTTVTLHNRKGPFVVYTRRTSGWSCNKRCSIEAAGQLHPAGTVGWWVLHRPEKVQIGTALRSV